LERYQAQHSDILRPAQQMARVLLMMDSHTTLRRRVLKAFMARPDLFAAMVRMHLQEETLPTMVLQHGIAFGRQLLSPAG